MQKKLILVIVLVFVLTACLPGQDANDVQNQIQTAVAETLAAQQQQIIESVALTLAAQNQGQQPAPVTASPTFTETPTPEIIVFPTLTPIVPTVTPVKPSGGGGGGGSAPKANFSCNVINSYPYDLTEFLHDADFDIKWTIVNNGTKTWPSGVDVTYSSGPLMTTVTKIEIPKEMKPGDTFQIILDAKAPSIGSEKLQVMDWVVEGKMCYPYIAIYVRN